MMQVKTKNADESQYNKESMSSDNAEKALKKINSGEPLKQYVAIRYLSSVLDQGVLKKIDKNHMKILNQIEIALKDLENKGEPTLSREASIVLQKMDSHFGPSKNIGPAPPQMLGLSCQNCNESVHWSWCYCPECGYDLEAHHCGGCGVQIERNWSFCPVCGRTLSV